MLPESKDHPASALHLNFSLYDLHPELGASQQMEEFTAISAMYRGGQRVGRVKNYKQNLYFRKPHCLGIFHQFMLKTVLYMNILRQTFFCFCYLKCI